VGFSRLFVGYFAESVSKGMLAASKVGDWKGDLTMNLNRFAALILLSSVMSFPLVAHAQTSQEAHDRAEREQTAKDHQHHTGAKIVGGSAVGGAVVGGLLGGGKGALIGGAVGAGGGAVGNKVRKDKAVKKREKREDSPR
jgi:uncharacterized protein YcfJ